MTWKSFPADQRHYCYEVDGEQKGLTKKEADCFRKKGCKVVNLSFSRNSKKKITMSALRWGKMSQARLL